jgi:GTP-binding protein LepA
MDQSHIRNFCIIAHIDHGKSTLADRLLELTSTVAKRDMKQQLLDSMDLEREKGITIKLAPVRMKYNDYELNLIDTPGHVDFSYEVSRSLAACEGALLVVDATQGVQAQTLANTYLAFAANLKIVPVLNKIDLPAADVPKVSAEIIDLLGCKEGDILKISAKTGEGVPEVLEAIVKEIPQPVGHADGPERALIFDSYYDDYRGVVLYIKVVDGKISHNSNIKMLATGASGIALEVGKLSPEMIPTSDLSCGEIGYIVTNLKTIHEAKVGDTIALNNQQPVKPLPGYEHIRPFVYAGFFPVSNEDFDDLKDAVEKLSLNDSALQFEPENSPVLGFGMRLGFLGLLHLDIIKERLEREYHLELIITNPSTNYQVKLTGGEELNLKSASDLPNMSRVVEIREPWVNGEIVVPQEYVGVVIQLVVSKRGVQKNMSYISQRALISFEAPLANLLTNFYDQLKSVTSGYGSFSYELSGYRVEDLVKIDFYVAGEIVEALSVMTHRSESIALGREMVKKLKDIIPRQNFQVSLQAAIGGKFIAREDISAYRKDVTGYLYGGDVSRRKKLLAKQVRGKKRMKRFGKVDIPSEAFMLILSSGSKKDKND